MVYPLSSMLGIGIFFKGSNDTYVSQMNFTISNEDLIFPADSHIIGPIHNSSQKMIIGSPAILNYVMKTNPRSIAKYDFTAG